MLNNLQFCFPEQEGVHSKDILNFLDLLESQKITLHSFMFVRNGKILAEAYAKPFIDEKFMHREYSSSKTYTAMAIGKIIGDGLIKIDDKLSSYFPEWIDENTHPLLLDVTVEDMLKMSVPYNPSHYAEDGCSDWAESYFKSYNCTPDIEAGTIFRYSTFATFMLCVLIEKVAGKTYVEVLRPIFDELGIGEVKSVLSPDGYAWGGSGVLSTMRDFAAFGEFIMNKGNVNGKQLIPLWYMEKAISKQIETGFDDYNCYNKIETCGYGYQIWIHAHGFSLLGLYGQRIFCFPEKNFMFVCNGDTMINGQTLYEAVEKCYLHICDGELAQTEDSVILKERLEKFAFPIDWGKPHSEIEQKINGKKYVFDENSLGIKWFTLNIEEDKGYFEYENQRGVKKIEFGLNRFIKSTFPETHYFDIQVGVPANRELNCVNYGAFNDNTFIIKTHLIDNFIGNLLITLAFKGDNVYLVMNKIAEFALDEYHGRVYGKLAE